MSREAAGARGARLPLPSRLGRDGKVADGGSFGTKPMSVATGKPDHFESTAVLRKMVKIIRLGLRARSEDLQIKIATSVNRQSKRRGGKTGKGASDF